jgi:hypothetical protein
MMMVASFSLTLGIMLWQRKRAELPEPIMRTKPVVPVIVPAPAPVHRAVQPLPAVEDIKDTAPSNAQISPGGTTSGQAEAPDMPVRVTFRHPMKLNKLVGKVFSSTNAPLVIAVDILIASTHNTLQTQLDLPPNGEATFGADDGMELASGDQVTLQCAPYRDVVSRVP